MSSSQTKKATKKKSKPAQDQATVVETVAAIQKPASQDQAKFTPLFRYTEHAYNVGEQAKSKVVIELAYSNPERPHTGSKIIGTIKQKRGQWGVYYDHFHGCSWRGDYTYKREAMHALATMAGVHRSSMVDAQINGASIFR